MAALAPYRNANNVPHIQVRRLEASVLISVSVTLVIADQVVNALPVPQAPSRRHPAHHHAQSVAQENIRMFQVLLQLRLACNVLRGQMHLREAILQAIAFATLVSLVQDKFVMHAKRASSSPFSVLLRVICALSVSTRKLQQLPMHQCAKIVLYIRIHCQVVMPLKTAHATLDTAVTTDKYAVNV
jgi:hypothetical protein